MQVISKNGKVLCVTETPYPAETVKIMKSAGYEIKTTKSKNSKRDML